ncbi:hypothetical protein tb265_12020 [Gemmatimonadetes bacterium T265]|nr:hypothetical protein tb265_12020 [Gemmatimonadetes bacterium T265]
MLEPWYDPPRYDAPPPAPTPPAPTPPAPTPPAPADAVALPEAVVEELDTLLAARAHTDDSPVDEELRRARAVEWAVRAEQRHQFAAAHGDVAAPHPTPPPPAVPPHPAA